MARLLAWHESRRGGLAPATPCCSPGLRLRPASCQPGCLISHSLHAHAWPGLALRFCGTALACVQACSNLSSLLLLQAHPAPASVARDAPHRSPSPRLPPPGGSPTSPAVPAPARDGLLPACAAEQEPRTRGGALGDLGRQLLLPVVCCPQTTRQRAVPLPARTPYSPCSHAALLNRTRGICLCRGVVNTTLLAAQWSWLRGSSRPDAAPLTLNSSSPTACVPSPQVVCAKDVVPRASVVNLVRFFSTDAGGGWRASAVLHACILALPA